MYCTKCGHKQSDSARFCSSCGAQIRNLTSDVIAKEQISNSRVKPEIKEVKPKKKGKIPNWLSTTGSILLIFIIAAATRAAVSGAFGDSNNVSPEARFATMKNSMTSGCEEEAKKNISEQSAAKYCVCSVDTLETAHGKEKLYSESNVSAMNTNGISKSDTDAITANCQQYYE